VPQPLPLGLAPDSRLRIKVYQFFAAERLAARLIEALQAFEISQLCRASMDTQWRSPRAALQGSL
jgi:hypothetical protein